MPRKRLDDERLIAALLENATIQDAAAAAGCSPSVIYERRGNTEFVHKLRKAQTEALSGTVRYLQSNTSKAASVLVDIAENGQQEQNRLNAARAILDQAARLTEVVDILERLDKLES